MLQPAAMLPRSLQIVFKRSQGVGEVIHLRATGYAPVLQKLVIDKAADTDRQLRRTRRGQHPHGARDLVHEIRRTSQLIVFPPGLDESNDPVFDRSRVTNGFLHQRRDDAKRLATRETMHGVTRGTFFLGTQALDVIVQRCFYVQ